MKKTLCWCLALFSGLAVAEEAEVKLILQVTVDGLRADLLDRSFEQFGAGGFRLLLEEGAVFTNAHYQHANTETIVGHATLATGAHPAVHGMTGNVWLDSRTGELAYNIEDPAAPILPTRKEEMKGAQVDPAQKLARSAGRSPRALLAETFTDRLHAHSKGESKIYAVSGKDRGSVALAGQSGKAFWASTDSGDFVTSAYYFDAYPAWAAEWNAERQAEAMAGRHWDLMNEKDTYLFADRDDRPYETDLRGYGRTFPHQFGSGANKLLYTQVIASPYGDRLTADFARRLLTAEKLGDDAVPDYLSISFSGLDAVNHFFGPSSLENEDMLLQLDRTLAGLLTFVDEQVGMDHALVVLSADHGMAELPEYMAEQGIETGRLTTDVVSDLAVRAAEKLFGRKDLVKFYYRPFIYLDSQVLAETGADQEEAASRIAAELARHPGVHLAITPQQAQAVADSKLVQRIRNNLHSHRSGDIYVVQERYWFNFDRGPVAGMHGSPWEYDTHIPIVFFGGQIRPGKIERAVQPADVAPTLSELIGIGQPGSSQGEKLVELIR